MFAMPEGTIFWVELVNSRRHIRDAGLMDASWTLESGLAKYLSLTDHSILKSRRFSSPFVYCPVEPDLGSLHSWRFLLLIYTSEPSPRILRCACFISFLPTRLMTVLFLTVLLHLLTADWIYPGYFQRLSNTKLK